jgi:exodeoxyribonuclease I
MLAPLATIKGVATERIGLDPDLCLEHARRLLPALDGVRRKVGEVFARSGEAFEDCSDPDRMLYSGGFFSPADRHLMKKILAVPPRELAGHLWSFQDKRLPLMLFRYRARNFPETLTQKEREAWDRDRRSRLVDNADPAYFTLADFRQVVAQLRETKADEPPAMRILDRLEAWVIETGIAEL